MMPPEYSPITWVVARRRYPFLLDRAADREDVRSVAALVRLLARITGEPESRIADRELYAYARATGWRRNQKGLPRGCGRGAKWERFV